MGKREFLEVLDKRLSDELPRSQVISHLQYYEGYINDAIKFGKKESEVMEELGDPVMIAHTIINTESGESFQGYAEDAEFTEIPKSDMGQEQDIRTEKKVEYTHVHTDDYSNQSKDPITKGKGSFNTGCLIAALVIILVVIGIVTIVGVLLPILLPVLFVLVLLTVIFGKNR